MVVKMFELKVCWRLACMALILGGLVSTPAALANLPGGISQSQIEQFKKLPRAQQEALARQYGIDINNLPASSYPTNRQRLEEPVALKTVDLGSDGQEAREDDLLDSQSDEEGGLKPFGYSLFSSSPSTFAPVTEIPIPSDYVLGPGDVLRVQMFGQQNQFLELLVDRDGQIQFPQVGPVSVAGMQFTIAREQLIQLVAEKFIGVTASVSLGELRSMRVFVLGDAKAPGAYTVSSLSTITNALLASGGVSLQGSLRNVEHRRNGKLVGRFDLYDLLLNGDTSKDSRLQPGDVIHIPPVGSQVGVQGEIRRPALYELKGGETVADVIRMAGGATDRAYTPQVSLSRIGENFFPSLKTLDLRNDGSLKVRSGDLLQIGGVSGLSDGFVALEGAVLRPGKVSYRPGLKLSDVLSSINESLSKTADLDYALIVREVNEKRDIQVIAFSPLQVLDASSESLDVELANRDRILIFSNETRGSNADARKALLEPVLDQLRKQAAYEVPQAIVGINGAVRFPGEYPLSQDETVSSLIRAAGGLLEGAFLETVEVSKVLVDDAGRAETTIHTLTGNALLSKHRLEPRDVVHVKGVPDFARRFNITLEGEVRFPGTYTVTQGETLGDVVKRAGGLTPMAYPKGAVFSRDNLRRKERERLQEAEDRLQRDLAGVGVQQANTRGGSLDDVSQLQDLLVKVQDMKPVGRLVINLEQQLSGRAEMPVLLEDGDRLIVPPLPQEVSVFGEVQFPTSHLVTKSMNMKDYVHHSGGVTKRADKKRIYVVRADGSVWMPRRRLLFFTTSYTPEPGDTIVVPMDIDRLNQLELWSSVSQIFYQMALGAAAVRSF